jgi:membrane protease YdiL (CAAX protease family)
VRGADAWWRSSLGVLLALAALLLLTATLNQVLVALLWTVVGDGRSYSEFATDAYAFALPGGLLAANLATAALAPFCWLLLFTLHRRRPAWLSSVRPGLRWPYLLQCLVVSLVVLVGGQLVAGTASPDAWALAPGAVTFLVVIISTTPLQAAAEEVIFRGYLLQAFGSLGGRWLAVLASALIFATLHGAQSPAMFVDRLGLGLLAGVLVIRTGGLEAVIAAHVVNNTFTYVSATLTTSVATVRATAGVGWLDAASDIGSFALVVGLALLVAHLSGLPRRVGAAAPVAGTGAAVRRPG